MFASQKIIFSLHVTRIQYDITDVFSSIKNSLKSTTVTAIQNTRVEVLKLCIEASDPRFCTLQECGTIK